jgi:hypothetical protein
MARRGDLVSDGPPLVGARPSLSSERRLCTEDLATSALLGLVAARSSVQSAGTFEAMRRMATVALGMQIRDRNRHADLGQLMFLTTSSGGEWVDSI